MGNMSGSLNLLSCGHKGRKVRENILRSSLTLLPGFSVTTIDSCGNQRSETYE